MKTIFIKKPAGEKQARRITKSSDIPEQLETSIVVRGEAIHLNTCSEGKENGRLGEVVAWEESDTSSTGFNCWFMDEEQVAKLEEVNGHFYETGATVRTAAPITDEFPSFLDGAEINRNSDGSWSIKTDWGVSTGFPGQAYWVLYGTRKDGSIDGNILTKSEKSYKDYLVCDENGNVIGRLCEIDP